MTIRESSILKSIRKNKDKEESLFFVFLEVRPIHFGCGVNWYPGEPNNLGGHEDYLDILFMDGEWGMNDAPNGYHQKTICEYKPSCE